MAYVTLPGQGDGTTTISDGTYSTDVTISGNTSQTNSGTYFVTGASDGGIDFTFSNPVYGLNLDLNVFDRGEKYRILINGQHYQAAEIVAPRRGLRNMIHAAQGNIGGGDARDGRSERVAVQLCGS